MKNCFLSLIAILFISSVVNAQYRLNKTMYNSKHYAYQRGDPYKPSVAGLTSFLIPGLGQMISGEVGRGAAFLGGFAGGAIMIIVGVNQSFTYTESSPGNLGDLVLVTSLVAIGFIVMIGVDIWSILDAIHVAKVNNLAFRDKTKTGFKVKVSPYIGSFRTETVPVGISLKVHF
jgi:TM2 domain-containing membrane protein YozV